MAEQMHMPQYGSHTSEPGSGPSSSVSGTTVFAGVIMIVVGLFQGLTGLAAIVEDQFYVVASNYVYDIDVRGWGWIHLIVGAVVLVAGFGVFSGKLWARAIGIFLAVVSAVANFLFIPYYPLWSLLVIALDVFVIWALASPGRRSTA